jgi:hypothetical protein
VTATLGGVLEHLELLRVLVAPGGLDARVSGVVVHDPVDPPRIEAGDLVLAWAWSLTAMTPSNCWPLLPRPALPASS